MICFPFILSIGCIDQSGSLPGRWVFNFENVSSQTVNLEITDIFNGETPVITKYHIGQNQSDILWIVSHSFQELILEVECDTLDFIRYIIEEIPVGLFTIKITNDGFEQNYGWIEEYK